MVGRQGDPSAIRARYEMSAPNQPLQVWAGHAEIDQGGQRLEGPTVLRLEWLPDPRFVADVSVAEGSWTFTWDPCRIDLRD